MAADSHHNEKAPCASSAMAVDMAEALAKI
ncbi:hypothetical protein HMPREF9336_01896 [Segniliparus rugosus ATCC BAA-974]|uniref:Uncharacterized protein n=1 Tax=Segniliparus rugosus (strain ATCC BAA-974 / DSM 45345 / CCUG 50838 / CIP 108380 / JCM 13579 / CDC 945) TaxID=679197 RepID=E5XQZ4_SEGRC|nr:hypothetical protein HMPREF9336_01896 [Segniliparus rugosus ATCC BAA-974]